jgi:hypothetical protein
LAKTTCSPTRRKVLEIDIKIAIEPPTRRLEKNAESRLGDSVLEILLGFLKAESTQTPHFPPLISDFLLLPLPYLFSLYLQTPISIHSKPSSSPFKRSKAFKPPFLHLQPNFLGLSFLQIGSKVGIWYLATIHPHFKLEGYKFLSLVFQF